jgi:hypothetical protein
MGSNILDEPAASPVQGSGLFYLEDGGASFFEMLLLIYQIPLHHVLADCNMILTTVVTQNPTYGALSLFHIYNFMMFLGSLLKYIESVEGCCLLGHPKMQAAEMLQSFYQTAPCHI